MGPQVWKHAFTEALTGMGIGEGKQNLPKMGMLKQMFRPETVAVTQPEIASASTSCSVDSAALNVSAWAENSLLAVKPALVKSGTSLTSEASE